MLGQSGKFGYNIILWFMIIEESNLLLGPCSKDLAVFIYIIFLRLQSLDAALCIYLLNPQWWEIDIFTCLSLCMGQWLCVYYSQWLLMGCSLAAVAVTLWFIVGVSKVKP